MAEYVVVELIEISENRLPVISLNVQNLDTGKYVAWSTGYEMGSGYPSFNDLPEFIGGACVDNLPVVEETIYYI